MNTLLHKGWKTSEFWVLIGTAMILVVDAAIQALTNSSLFAQYPDLRQQLIEIAAFWTSVRTVFKLIIAVVQGKLSNTTEQPVIEG